MERMASYMRANGLPQTLGAESLDGFGLPCWNPTAVNNDLSWQFCNGGGVAETNICRKSCCNYHLRNECCLHLLEQLPRQFNKNIPIRPSSNQNRFQFDSGYCEGGSEFGAVSELVNSNILRSLSYDNHIHHMQQHPNYSSLEDLRELHHKRQHSKYRLHQLPNYFSMEDMRGQIMLVAKDQHGTLFLQKKLEDRKAEEIEMIFLEVKDHLCEIMVDRFANYLVQKLVAVCNEQMSRPKTHHTIYLIFVWISRHDPGTNPNSNGIYA